MFMHSDRNGCPPWPTGRPANRCLRNTRRRFSSPRLSDHTSVFKYTWNKIAIRGGTHRRFLKLHVGCRALVNVNQSASPAAFRPSFFSATTRRVNGARLRKELEDKLNSEDHVAITLGGPDGVPGYGRRDASGGFDVTVEGVAISGPLETAGEIRAAMEHDWRSADIGGECSGGAR